MSCCSGMVPKSQVLINHAELHSRLMCLNVQLTAPATRAVIVHAMQSRIQGYMYNITSETDYSERMLPPTPPREKEASPPTPARHVSQPRHHRRGAAAPACPSAEPVQDGQAAGGRARRDGRRRLQARQRVSGSGLLHASHFSTLDFTQPCRSAFPMSSSKQSASPIFLVAGVSLLEALCGSRFTDSPRKVDAGT